MPEMGIGSIMRHLLRDGGLAGVKSQREPHLLPMNSDPEDGDTAMCLDALYL